MDTNVLMKDFNELLNDNRFLEEDNSLPDIVDNIDDFLDKYINYCQRIAIGRRQKIEQIIRKKTGLSEEERLSQSCQSLIVEKIRQMINECDSELSDEDKNFLKWRENSTSSNNFASVPKEDTVKKWLYDTRARNPDRMYLYKIAFALGLKAYYPNEIKDTSSEYQISVNYLFNKIYNQRYCTRIFTELIFIFCLKRGKNYTTAMKMVAQYIKSPKAESIELNEENNTLYFIQQSSDNDENGFVNYLLQITPILNDRYSSVFSQIEEVIEYFHDEDTMHDFEEKYSKTHMNTMLTAYDEYRYSDYPYMPHMNLGEKVLISDIVKKWLIFLDNRMKISSALYNYQISSNDDGTLMQQFAELGISPSLYQHLKNPSVEDFRKRFGNNQQYFSDIISEIIITKNDIYNSDIITRMEKNDGTYTWRPENNELSHDLIYKKLRNALITAHFFYYWSATDSELSYEGYLEEINEWLTNSFYQPMYIKNSFDCFFLFCAKTVEPIDAYYSIFNQIFYIYDDYQKEFMDEIKEEFAEYDNYTMGNRGAIEISVEINKIPTVVMSECLHPIDQTDIQEKILKVIKQYATQMDRNN